MPHYRVLWEIDIEADSPQEAAAQALIIQRDNDPANSANVFEVRELVSPASALFKPAVTVDLSDELPVREG